MLFCCLLGNLASAHLNHKTIIQLRQELETASTSPYGRVGVSFLDLKSGLSLSIDGNTLYPAASVAKVPVMAAVYHLAEAGKVDLQERLHFREQDKLGGSGVLQWMRGGRDYTLRNLTRLMIVLSDNTATRMVINRIGTQEINAYLHSIKLLDTVVVDSTCLDECPGPRMNYTTPNDMARLLYDIYVPGHFTEASKKEMIGYMKFQRYRWGIWRGVPRGVIVADKTGDVDGVLNDAGIVYGKNGDYILTVFTNGFKKPRVARKIINKISEIVYGSTL